MQYVYELIRYGNEKIPFTIHKIGLVFYLNPLNFIKNFRCGRGMLAVPHQFTRFTRNH